MDDKGGFRELVGAELSEAEGGCVVIRMRAEDRHLNPGGTVHGGAVSTLVDVSMAEALNTTVAEEGERPVTVEIKVNYMMAPGKPGVIASTARVRKGGKRVTVVEAEVVQEEDEEVVALATGTYTIVG